MAFTRFLKDMNIISALANKPVAEGGLTASQFKAKFDEGGLALKEFVNALCGELENGSAAAWIGIQSITGLDATTIQGALTALKELASQVSSHASTHGTGGSDPITPANIGAAASTHTHTPASIGAAASNHTHTPASIGAAAESHNHSASNITSGTLSISRGGTGATTAAAARSNIDAAAADHDHDASKIVSGYLSMDRIKAGDITGAEIKNHTLTRNKLDTFLLLDGSTDYGDSLPAAGNAGRIFFKKV